MPQINLRAARVNAGLKQSQAASAIGISDTKLRDWQKGIGLDKMTLGQRIKIGEIYQIPIECISLPIDIGDA